MRKEITPEYLASQRFSATLPKRFMALVNKNGPIPEHWPELGPCWEWLGKIANHGYGVTTECIPPYRQRTVHTVSYLLFIGEIPEGKCVLHKCDFRPCCNPKHLWTGTRPENSQDMKEKGRSRRGEGHPNSRITEANVLIIRKLWPKSQGIMSMGEIGNMFGISQTQVSRIVNRKRWGWL